MWSSNVAVSLNPARMNIGSNTFAFTKDWQKEKCI